MADSTQAETLAAYEETISLLMESLADVERIMRRDDTGWDVVGSDAKGFTTRFRKSMAERAEIAATADPIIKRGVNLRAAYIWGAGVQISVRDQPDQGQDVNAVVQGFLDDPRNQATFSTVTAKTKLERRLATCGEVFACLPTDPYTGRVRLRVLPQDQIVEIVTDPEDADTTWFYLRDYTVAADQRHIAYPDITYSPVSKPDRLDYGGTTYEVHWDAPVRAILVNEIRGRGVGDVFAALPWAQSYKRFLESWAKLTESLSRFAWRYSTRGDKTAAAAAQIQGALGSGDTAGLGVSLDPNSRLQAISKSGATINSESGRPLAAMAGAGLDLPVTTLLGDPGVTGARAVASDITESSWALFDLRRDLWRSVIRDICGYVIDQAVIAPAGPLNGTAVRDGDQVTAELPAEDGRTIVVDFPERDDTDLLDKVKAIQIADQSETIPRLVVARLLLEALRVDHADEVLDQITDDHGNFIPLDLIDAAVRQAVADRGGVDL